MDMHATVTEAPARKTPPIPRNGVDTPKLFATIGAVAGQPSLAQFKFRAKEPAGEPHAVPHHDRRLLRRRWRDAA